MHDEKAYYLANPEQPEDQNYSDQELQQFSIQTLDRLLHTRPESALVIGLWETIRDHLQVSRKEKLTRLAIEAASADDHGVFTIPLMEEIAYSYAISFNTQNAIHDFALKAIKSELIEELEQSL